MAESDRCIWVAQQVFRGIHMPTSIYAHVPFCLARCAYCNFYSGEAHEGMEDYPANLALEARLRRAFFPAKQAETLYMGGGTPSLLGPKRLGEAICAIASVFPLAPGAEVTVEVNPAASPDIASYPAAGVNRVSVGVQSLNDGLLATLGRPHDAAQALETVKSAVRAGLSVSADLIYGYAGLTAKGLMRDAEALAEAGARHLSAYSLEAGGGCKVEPAAPEDDEAQAEALVERLGELGFVQYEVSNFALPGFESRHNTGYWEGWNYMGLGPGAHGYLAHLEPHGTRYSNAPNLAAWKSSLLAGEIPPGESAPLTASEALLEHLFLTLRRRSPFDPADFNAHPQLEGGFARLQESGDLAPTGDSRLIPTDKGLLRADGLATHLHALVFNQQ